MHLIGDILHLWLLFALLGQIQAKYTEPHCDDKQVLVHLFEWPHEAVARECEEVLGPKGFCGVQVSPPNEHIQGDYWWTRYQPVSYKLVSRSGNRDQFINMVERCNAAGVMVVVDLVLNHMSGHSTYDTGIGGSSFDGRKWEYPAVPYEFNDFHQPYCEVNNFQDPYEVRNCYLVGLNDLNGGSEKVRGKIADYVNDLIMIGVKGFRVDASKHMWPGDLEAIQQKWQGDPFVFHEVIDQGGEPIHTYDYFSVGKVTEFRSCLWVGSCVANHDYDCLKNFGNGLSDGLHAVVFVDNHDNQRGHGGGGPVLSYKNSTDYKMAVSFLMAQEYGFKRVMSSYFFDDKNQGPPGSPPNSMTSGECGNGWVCEHRWSTTMNMVKFANAVVGTKVENWQVKEGSLGFSRGTKGFFAMGDLNNVEFYTGLPDGEYCDIIHDCKQKIHVSGGMARFNKVQDNDPVAAICVDC